MINEVHLVFKFQCTSALVSISLGDRDAQVRFRVLIPDLHITPHQILNASANEQFSCIPSLIYPTDGVMVQLRRIVSVSRESEQEVVYALDEVINDSIRLMELGSAPL